MRSERRFSGWRGVVVGLYAVTVGACGGAVIPGSDAGSRSDGGSLPTDGASEASADAAGSCVLPGGGLCPVGASCPAGDGCNTCRCEPSGLASCTLLGCVPQDAGPPPVDAAPPPVDASFPRDSGTGACSSAADCGGGMECVFENVGACGALGRCSGITDCASITAYCGCDGSTFMDCPGRPTRPAVSTGPCTMGSCTGTCAPGATFLARGVCLGAVDNGCPAQCCNGWSCDTRTTPALCAMPAPACPAGYTNSISGACWGPCVPVANCAPIACMADRDCPSNARCDTSTNRCVAR